MLFNELDTNQVWFWITVISGILILLNIKEIVQSVVSQVKKIQEGKLIDALIQTIETEKGKTFTVRKTLTVILFVILLVLLISNVEDLRPQVNISR